MKPALLFRLHNISENADWDKAYTLPLPEGCAAIAVSGGIDDLVERRRGKSATLDGSGKSYILTPFLCSAPNLVVTRIIWSLLGFGGRFYPIYRVGRRTLEMRGFDPSNLPDTKFDVLASLKFQSLQAAQAVNWTSDFTTCFSDGLGLGFWGEVTELEKKLKRTPDLTRFDMATEVTSHASIHEHVQETHPYLFACWQEYGLEWLLQNASFVMRPWGWEGEDAIFLSAKMSHDEMIDAIHRDLKNDAEIHDYDGDETYLQWASWRYGGFPEDRQWI